MDVDGSTVYNSQQVETADVHQLKTEQTKCAMSTQWNITQQLKGMIHVTTWINSEYIMLSERRWLQKTMSCII